MFELSITYNQQILNIDPSFAEAYSNLGTTYRAMAQAGHSRVQGVSINPAELAERYYRIAISIRPKYWDASINLAGLLSSNGRWREAVEVYQNIEELMEKEFDVSERLDVVDGGVSEGEDGDFFRKLWEAERRRRKRCEFEVAMKGVATGDFSGFSVERRRDLYYAKGNLLYAIGEVAEAKRQYLKGLTAAGVDVTGVYAAGAGNGLPQPGVTPASALGALQASKGGRGDGIYHPTTSSILQTLAKIYQDLQRMGVAVAFYYVSLSVYPTANTCNNLGILLAPQRLNESVTWYELGLQLDPNHVHIFTNLGSALKDRGQVTEGIACYQRAIQIQPDFYIALANLANVFKDMGRVEEAIDLYRRALAVKPDFVEAFCNFVNSLLFVCDWTGRGENLDRIREVVKSQLRDGKEGRIKPRGVPTVLPFHTFTYSTLSAWMVREISRRNAERALWNVEVSEWFPGFPARPIKLLGNAYRELGRDSEKAERLLERCVGQYPYPYKVPEGPRPYIRVGYLSSDFNNHPLAHLMQSVFGLHDRAKFRVYCYALSPTDHSPYRAKIEREADVFLDVSSWGVKEIVERIVGDGIHVL
ncbi:hypothetical protein HK097_002820, partial [Rhizophlyctis rosea]